MVLLAAAVGLARAGAGQVQIPHASRPDATLPPGPPAPENGAPVTPFTLTVPPPAAAAAGRITVAALDGGTARTLAELRGPRATVIAFVASYCIPCRQEVPDLLARAPGLERAGVRVLIVDLQEDPSSAAGFLRSRGLTSGGYLDGSGSAHDGLGLIGIPSSAILGADGGVAERLEGWQGPDDLAAALHAMGISPQ